MIYAINIKAKVYMIVLSLILVEKIAFSNCGLWLHN